MYLTKLTGATTLFLMTILCTSLLGNSLTIWNARLLENDIEFFVVLQTPLQGTKVELTLTTYNHLSQLLALLHDPCRVFLAHLQESSHQLLCILGIDSLDSTRVLRVRIFDEVETPLSILAIQGIARLHVFQLHGTTDVTSIQLLDSHTVGTSASINLSDALLATTVGIGQVVTRLDATAHHLEVTYLADVRFHTRLEKVNALRAIAVRSNFLTTSIVQLRHIVNERNHIAQELHQAANAHRLTCANTEYREDATSYQSLADTLTHLILCQALALEELLHQSLVVLGSCLDKSLVQFHRLVHLLLRNFLDDRSTALWLPRIFLHQKYVNERIETRTCL